MTFPASWDRFIVDNFWPFWYLSWIALLLGTSQYIRGFLRARDFGERAVYVAMCACTYYVLALHLMLNTFVDPLLQRLESLANQAETNATDPAPANLENDFTARALDAREDYWTTENHLPKHNNGDKRHFPELLASD